MTSLKPKIRANYRSLISELKEVTSNVILIFLPFILIPSTFALVVVSLFFGPESMLTVIACTGVAFLIIWILAISQFLVCLFKGHQYRGELGSISGFRGDEIIFEGLCSRCAVRLDISARYDALEFPAYGDARHARVDYLSIPDRVERDARLAIAEAVRRGNVPPEGAVRVFALYHMVRQARALRKLGLRRRGGEQHVSELSLREVLEGVGVRLDFKASEGGIFQLQLSNGCLYVEAPQHLTFLWRELGTGLDIIELKVVEVLKNVHANQIIALIQLLGRPLPKSDPIILDMVMVGRDSTGPWLLRAPPSLWNSPLERQLSWASGLRTPRRRGFIEA